MRLEKRAPSGGHGKKTEQNERETLVLKCYSGEEYGR